MTKTFLILLAVGTAMVFSGCEGSKNTGNYQPAIAEVSFQALVSEPDNYTIKGCYFVNESATNFSSGFMFMAGTKTVRKTNLLRIYAEAVPKEPASPKDVLANITVKIYVNDKLVKETTSENSVDMQYIHEAE